MNSKAKGRAWREAVSNSLGLYLTCRLCGHAVMERQPEARA